MDAKPAPGEPPAPPHHCPRLPFPFPLPQPLPAPHRDEHAADAAQVLVLAGLLGDGGQQAARRGKGRRAEAKGAHAHHLDLQLDLQGRPPGAG